MFKFDEYRVEAIDLVYDADGCELGAVCALVTVWDRVDYSHPLINKRTVWMSVDNSNVSIWAECPMDGPNRWQSYWVEMSDWFDNNCFNSKLIDGTCTFPTDNLFEQDGGLVDYCAYPIWYKLYQVLHQPGFDWLA